MSTALEIAGKNFHPVREAAGVVSYSRDYITRLAREKKITAAYVGRQWFVNLDSLQSYVESAALEQEVRKKQLSVERKRENELRSVTKQKHMLHMQRAKSLHGRAVAVASLVLMAGLATGLATYQLAVAPSFSEQQVASTIDTQTPEQLSAPELATQAVTFIDSATGQVTYSQDESIRSLGDVRNGILLLPSNDSSSIRDMLSDEVVVREDVSGSMVIVQVDTDGREIGAEVPFVVVPVEGSEIQM